MKNISATTTDPARAGFTIWLKGETGSILARREREKIGRILSGLFGYHITQIGHYDAGLLDSAGRIRNKIELHLDDDGLQDCECGVLSSVASLPFAAHSIDVVVIPHVLCQIMENISATTSTDPARAGFTEWLNSEAGSILARREREKIGRILSGLFGYHITQIGHYDAGLLDSAGRIRNKIELHLDDDGLQDCECGVLSSVASLPFAAHSR